MGAILTRRITEGCMLSAPRGQASSPSEQFRQQLAVHCRCVTWPSASDFSWMKLGLNTVPPKAISRCCLQVEARQKSQTTFIVSDGLARLVQ